MKKRTTYIKNYSSGRRREIVGLILQSGGLTNRGLRLYWNKENEYKNKSQIVAKLIEEGIITEQKIRVAGCRQVRIYTFNSFGEKSKEYIEEYKMGSYANYNNYLSKLKKDVGDTKNTLQAYRAAQSINANTMMFLAGYECGAYPMYTIFDKRLTKKGEGKRFTENENIYFQNIYPKTLFQIKSRSRSQGTLIHQDGEVYAVYNIGEHRPKWRNEDEKTQWSSLIEPVCRGLSEEGFTIETGIENRKAILISEEKPILDLLRDSQRTIKKKKGVREDYLKLPSMYRNGLYYIPFSDFGVKLLQLMNRRNWREEILKQTLGSLYGTAMISNGIGHDAWEEGKMTLCFTVPDIEKLRSFSSAAISMNDKEMFRVICFSEQYNLINEILGDYVTIEVVNIESYIRCLEPVNIEF